MKRVYSILLMAAALPVLAAAQNATPAGAGTQEEPRRRPRIPAELSELLTHSELARCEARPTVTRQGFRVVSWNIRAGRSAPIDQIASELKAMDADVIALQEVDVLTRRTGFVDQPAALASALQSHYTFAASIKWDGGDYGLALLSKWPLVSVARHRLERSEAAEPRIVLEAVICAAGRPLRVFNHHADGRPASREPGLAALREIVAPELGRGVLVAGDFNDVPDAPAVRALVSAGLFDVGGVLNMNTTPSGRIDYVLIDEALNARASGARVWTTELSDHHAVVADLNW